MARLMVGLPAYNEENNIGVLIDKIIDQEKNINNLGYEVIIVPVDDKSKDKTKEVIFDKMSSFNNVLGLFHEENKNLGGVMNTLINYFLNNYKEDDVLIVMDGDNTHPPEFIIPLLKRLKEGYDIVICSRYREGSVTNGVPQNRLFFTFGARIYYTLVLHIKGVRDYTCGYRAYTYELIKSGREIYKEDLIKNSSFACMMELLYKLYKCGARISEVPFTLHYDLKGVCK